jgi:hypothetical protein
LEGISTIYVEYIKRIFKRGMIKIMAQILLAQNLELPRCPHCAVDNPNLTMHTSFDSSNHKRGNPRRWAIYICSRCGGVVTAFALQWGLNVINFFPNNEVISSSIPSPAFDYLQQSIDSIHAPAGAVMLAASAVDAMLKTKGYKDGSLYKRIDQAATNHLITTDMAQWAHEVRLDANDQRHADERVTLPSEADARKAAEFTLALGEFLFVLPSKIQRGLSETE